MSERIRKPKLVKSEIIKEIRNRTLYPKETINEVFRVYNEILEESIEAGVDCEMPDIGYFTCLQVEPKEDITVWNPKTHIYDEHIYRPGYKRLKFKVRPKIINEMKESTAVAPWKEKEKKENE